MTYTAADIARHVQGEVLGDPTVPLAGFAPADAAQPGDLTFAENEDYFRRAEQSAATAILVSAGFTSTRKVLIRVRNPRVAFASVLPLFFPERKFTPGIHPSAVVAPSAQVDATAHVGPLCVIDERAKIGAGCVLEAGDYVGPDCQLAEDVRLFPSVTLCARTQVGARVRMHPGVVVGGDGFGYVFDHGRHLKVPQIGHVILEDDVEIGANACIDRGALGPTVIGKGTKIDNLVQIGHNVRIGEHCILCGQAGVSGSTQIGRYTTLAGQAGLAGHLKIGSQVTIAAQSGVMHDIPDGQNWFGSPAQPDRQTKRLFLALQRLPELLRRVSELEQRLGERDGAKE